MMGEFKKKFSEVIEIVKQGEEITIKSDNLHEDIAVLIPFEKYNGILKRRKLGILESKASFSLKKGFEITDGRKVPGKENKENTEKILI